MIDNNLTEEEAFPILAYSAHSAHWLNSALRHQTEISKCKQMFSDNLNRSLSKMRSFNGIVFRMDFLSEPQELAWFESKINCIFTTPFFLSTSKENWKNSDVVWQIQNLPEDSFGKDISNLCQAPSEQEVLFMKDAKFQITKVDLQNNIVFLEERERYTKSDFPLHGIYTQNF